MSERNSFFDELGETFAGCLAAAIAYWMLTALCLVLIFGGLFIVYEVVYKPGVDQSFVTNMSKLSSHYCNNTWSYKDQTNARQELIAQVDANRDRLQTLPSDLQTKVLAIYNDHNQQHAMC